MFQDQKPRPYYGGRYSSGPTIGRSNPSGPRKRASSYSDKVVTAGGGRNKDSAPSSASRQQQQGEQKAKGSVEQQSLMASEQ